MRGIVLAALAALLLIVPVATAAPPDAPTSCRIDRPDGLWNEDYVDLGTGPWDTHLHHGLNSNFNEHTRPIGRVRAVMIFVDFEDAKATEAPENQQGRNWRLPQSYWDLLRPGVDLFTKSSNGRFNLDTDLVPTWFRMPKNSTEYGMNRTDWTIAKQQAYMREAVAVADAQVDFSPYSIVYVMPPRNATGIEFSPELNFYQEPLRPDGKVIRNGVTYGNDIFIWGHRIINHETGHDISFPESYNGGPGDTHQWVGGWDVMGDPLGHAPDNMAWNKWKVGWLDNHDIGCVASDGTADITLSANGAPSDGGLTKKAAVVRTGPHTALIAELREPVGADATETITPGPHRLCDWGVLLYKLDVLKLNSYGSIQVIDQMPGSTQAGCGRDLDIATLGKGQGDGPSRYEDADTGTVFEVRAIDDAAGSATLRVTRAATRIEAAPASGVGPLTTTLTAKQLAAPAGATYSWSFGATGASVEHTFPVGRHAVTLTVRDGDAVIGTATKTVNVFAPATGDVALSAPANAATDADAQIAASLPGQDVTIEVYRRVAGTAYPLVASGTDSLKYRSPIAATDVVVACAAAGQSCVTSGRTLAADGSNLRAVPVAQRTIEWRSAGEWQELWDGETLAGWEYAGTGASNRNFMASLAGSGGSAANAGVLFYGARQFKDFELSVDYRASATNSNGGVLLRFPRPATMADADRNGYQVAVLDNGTAATRSGALLQERPAVSYAPSNVAAAKPTREWNTLTIRAIRSHVTVRLNGVLVSEYHDARLGAGHIGLENAGTGVMYRHVRVREFGADEGTVGGTVPATLSLTMGTPASFGAFTPGVARTYTASTTATVTSSAGDATLSVSDPGHLRNGAFELPQPLQVTLAKSTWTGPTSNEAVNVGFTQRIEATDALRTGAYSKTLTFTLSTTSP